MAKEYQFLPQKDQSTVNTPTIYHSHTTFHWRASGDIPSAQQSAPSRPNSPGIKILPLEIPAAQNCKRSSTYGCEIN